MPTQFTPPFPENGTAAPAYADWLAQVQKDLKDPNAYDGLRWHSPEGFTVEPYYTAEQTDSQRLVATQAMQKSTPGWLNTPAYDVETGEEKILNARLRNALTNGADALLLNVPDETSLTRLLDSIKLSDSPVFFRLNPGVDGANFWQSLHQIAPYQLKGGIFSGSGTLPAQSLANLIEQSSNSPNFRVIGISSHDFHAAGATATQELAFTMARLAETYEQLLEHGFTPEQLVPKTTLSVSVGASYFMEIAKLRALRVLTARIFPAPTGQTMLVHCQTSTFYEAKATPYTNLLRATTEAMAAVIGGADALTIRPYDAVSGITNEFSERIARNVSTLMKAESYLDKVADPAAGSYYIENLTQQLVEAAWTLFQQVQNMGSFTKAMEAGNIQLELDSSYAAKVNAVRNGRVLVGVTKFRHDESEGEPAKSPSDRNGEPLVGLSSRRLAEPFE